MFKKRLTRYLEFSDPVMYADKKSHFFFMAVLFANELGVDGIEVRRVTDLGLVVREFDPGKLERRYCFRFECIGSIFKKTEDTEVIG